METTQTSTLKIAGQTIEQSSTMSMDLSQTVRAGADGKSKRMTLKYERVAMDMSVGGQKLSFDSSKSDQAPDPLGCRRRWEAWREKNCRFC